MIEYSVTDAIQILERTPSVLRVMLGGLTERWIHASEGPDTFTPFDNLGHLIHGERTDWIPRARIILSQSDAPFEPFDRFAQERESEGKSVDQLLSEFEAMRRGNLHILSSWRLNSDHLALQGVHPALGRVTLRQLLSTWTAHDLGHIAQIARVMAKQYRDEVGPWRQYLPIMDRA